MHGPGDAWVREAHAVFDLALVTADATLLAMKGVDLLPNRAAPGRK